MEEVEGDRGREGEWGWRAASRVESEVRGMSCVQGKVWMSGEFGTEGRWSGERSGRSLRSGEVNSQREPSSQPTATRKTGRRRFRECASFAPAFCPPVTAPRGIRAAANDVTFPLACLSQSGSASPCAELEGRS